MEDYPAPWGMSYIEDLNYTAFNEGVAHVLPYAENLQKEEKFKAAKGTLRAQSHKLFCFNPRSPSIRGAQ